MKILPFLILFCSLQARATVCENRGPNVILFTWDGVRGQEFFRGTGAFHALELKKEERGEIFSTFWKKHAGEGMVLGGGNRYKIGSRTAVSLPSYQALTLGKATACTKNKDCPPIQEESVLETIQRSLHLQKKDVAVFASWNRIQDAAAKNLELITNGVYPNRVLDETMSEDMLKLQEEGLKDLPEWNGSRKDHYTFELGLGYLKKNCPRLLWISLVDSDEYGHEGKYPEYVRSLRQYDQYLDRLLKALASMGDYGKQTTLIVTTDHSRGAGPLWRGHGVTKNTEKNIFLFATGRGVKPIGRVDDRGLSLQVRPTLEYLMGLSPSGQPLPNILVE